MKSLLLVSATLLATLTAMPAAAAAPRGGAVRSRGFATHERAERGSRASDHFRGFTNREGRGFRHMDRGVIRTEHERRERATERGHVGVAVAPYWGYDPFWWDWTYGPYPYWTYGPYAVPTPYGRRGSAVVDTEIRPHKAEVFVDGEEMGTARHFNGNRHSLWLQPGEHAIKIEAPGYMTLELDLHAKEGRYYRLQYHLKRGQGLDPRSMTADRTSNS